LKDPDVHEILVDIFITIDLHVKASGKVIFDGAFYVEPVGRIVLVTNGVSMTRVELGGELGHASHLETMLIDYGHILLIANIFVVRLDLGGRSTGVLARSHVDL
jgi:hypothetical protein